MSGCAAVENMKTCAPAEYMDYSESTYEGHTLNDIFHLSLSPSCGNLAASVAAVQPADERREKLMAEVRKDPVLQKQLRAMLGMPEQGSEAAIHAENTRALAASLTALKRHCKSNIGRIAYNTALAVAAGAGEHTCSSDDPCDPARRCRPAKPESGVTLHQRAESLGVRMKTFRDAFWRMNLTDHSKPPSQALEEGRYCWVARRTRSDATDPRVLELAVRFWHTDDISRASGDSGIAVLL